MKILIIEDSKMLNNFLYKELSSSGYEVTQAFTLKESWEYLSENGYDLIILDLHLPDGEGVELIEKLHNVSDAKVVILSSLNDKCLREELFRYGILDYIIKNKNLKYSLMELQKIIKFAAEKNKGDILIIEDSKFLNKQLKNILLPRNYNVSTAYTFKDGIGLLNKNSYDLVILDLNLPDGHGVDILEQVRENNNTIDLPVIVLSGEATPDLIREALKKGANDYLSKPFVIEELILRVDLWIEYYKNKKELADKTVELKKINENLKKMVQEEVKKNREKDKLLILQSRHAQMGELLSIISHEWMQPINAISSIASIIQLSIFQKDINEEFCEESAIKIKKYVGTLNEIMNNFKNFFKPHTRTTVTNFEKITRSALSLLESYIQKTETKINTDIINVEDFETYENEIVQVVVNIIKNAIEAYGENKEKVIDITVDKKTLVIQDYAGGIPEDLEKDIFEQYFSTKGNKGTGIGLYISKIIIEDHCKGKIKAENVNGGARFTIML